MSGASLKEIQSNYTATEVVNVCNNPEPACENVELVTSEIDCSLNTCSMDQSISHEVECADNTRSLYSESYEVYGIYSALHDDCSTSHSRHLAGTKRRQTAFLVNQDGDSNYYHHQFDNTNTLALVGRGSLTDLKSKSSLSKAKLEYLSSQRFSDDNWDDLILLQKITY